ncbi:MAG: DEAD/DEAH box helicase [Microscillaceae bacterium]|nr:DEAD/DEAH box helicase [Microscillaceae bacterium]
MKVSTTQPFQIVYSVFQHEYLGYLLESYVVQLNSKGELTFQHQNISSQNAGEFKSGLDDIDFQLIKIIETIQQEYIVKHFYSKKIKTTDFFLKIYDKKKGNKAIQEAIDKHLEEKRKKIIQLLKNDKMVFVMGRDGNPAWKRIYFAEDPATVLFHFRRNQDNTHYFPTIKYKGNKLEFQYKDAFVLCNQPAWMVLHNTIHFFGGDVDGNKIKPFLNKKFIAIPRKLEATYYQKFVAPLIASYDVYAVGLEIQTHHHEPRPVLHFAEYCMDNLSLFPDQHEEQGDSKIKFELYFSYGPFKLRSHDLGDNYNDKKQIQVEVEEKQEEYTFHRIQKNMVFEHETLALLKEIGLDIQKGVALLSKGQAFEWINTHAKLLKEKNFLIEQKTKSNKKYFLGKAEINLQIQENKDWFDIYAKIHFGEYEISFFQLRKLILQKKTEFKLPNGEIAVIPDTWIEQYTELFAFSENKDGEMPKLNKHHLSLVEELKNGNYAQVTMSRKLQKFKDFEKIEDYPLAQNFNGQLRSYQKAGYNWLHFLNKYRFGGCLADDMGLGKTVQTLAFLQSQKESMVSYPSLLVIPTSLIYNWELEAKKFTPDLKVFIYTGTNRNKEVAYFKDYDLIITSYGIIRIDIDILKGYYFNYVILDESQAIKNPNSNISQAVHQLKSINRLILTGTPLENTTLDLWSQISFINPGLLGTSNFFKNEFLNPIEKKNDLVKLQKLSKIIKPFILRRLKSQVAVDLPDKIENIQYCLMTEQQEREYERVKSQYRNEIIKHIDKEGVARSQFLLLQGLTKLRQIANHPQMIDSSYKGDSGKLEDIQYKLESIISEGHKVLIFSQFVKHLEILKKYVKERSWNFAYLDGSTKDRKAQVDLFQYEDSVKIFLISLKAGGVGLNLTAAEYVFLIDPWWNPAIEAQAIDRAHRIGQKNTVFTYKFITKNTVEEKILALQKDKRRLAEDLIHTEESFVKSLTKEDVLSLLE